MKSVLQFRLLELYSASDSIHIFFPFRFMPRSFSIAIKRRIQTIFQKKKSYPFLNNTYARWHLGDQCCMREWLHSFIIIKIKYLSISKIWSSLPFHQPFLVTITDEGIHESIAFRPLSLDGIVEDKKSYHMRFGMGASGRPKCLFFTESFACPMNSSAISTSSSMLVANISSPPYYGVCIPLPWCLVIRTVDIL